ncbi:hypothetical protein HIM_05891 [Hirsutella minnesotensis 3608]|uniref:YMC020W-like alpha/beta hydrolase domain-containing protein n=1 Tax=Hirsutella minnesotensis 3608 TaxID=1043627 RepID=A0A0F8A562_9HYPO|nr:hypothetical protein HIM_05891 [Hirsutella minnesotensis 3608]
MMLPRKRQRPNPVGAGTSPGLPTTALSREVATSQAAHAYGYVTAAATSATASSAVASGHLHVRPHPPPPAPFLRSQRSIAALSATTRGSDRQLRKAKSWYGSWPKAPTKATASTSVARENILGGTLPATRPPDLARFEHKRADDTASLHSARTAPPLPGVPEIAMATGDGDGGVGNSAQRKQRSPPSPEPGADLSRLRVSSSADPVSRPQATPLRKAASYSLLGWWSRTPVAESPAESCSSPRLEAPAEEAQKPLSIQTAPQTAAPDCSSASVPTSASTSWFGLWSSAADASTQSPAGQATHGRDADKDTQDVVVPAPTPTPPPSRAGGPPPQAGSTWAFWFREPAKAGHDATGDGSGEIAVMGEGSEDRPKPMAEGTVSGPEPPSQKAEAKPKETRANRKSTWRRGKRLRPSPSALDIRVASAPVRPVSPADTMSEPEPEIRTPTIRPETPVETPGEAAAATQLPPNLLLPCFSSTYQMKENPSILRQIANFLLRTSQPPANHVLRIKDTPKIRKAIAIGIHGLIPATYLRPMIGQPTGTSVRFANFAADAIRKWADDHDCADCEIEKIALEGEGRISERVDNLWKLLLNWIGHIRRADLIVVASHSQGVPVSIMLLEKLIELGLITDAKIGVCAMAGVSLGPFPDYRSSILMGSAAELFDFGNPYSAISLRFETALKTILDYGARVTFIGSLDDQLVPMESAVYSPASHPYIYRAVFIDGRLHAPDFIAHLVGFALKLRNLGISDHGLIRELSAPLAGSLYSGEGHSRLYYDAAVYDLAVAHTLETAPTPTRVPCEVRQPTAESSGGVGPMASANPYVLPWIMRGVLEEGFVKTELGAETEELLRQFDDWRPATKALKDVKYRLEAVRSKL